MSFIADDIVVETGAGLPTANSYVSAEDARKYLRLQGRSSEGIYLLSDEQLGGFLVQGAQYIDTNFEFIGDKKNQEQGLQFPRTDQTTVPDNVRYAAIESADMLQKGEVYQDPGETETHIIEERVGPIATKYSENSSHITSTSPKIDRLTRIQRLLSAYISRSLSSAGQTITVFQRG